MRWGLFDTRDGFWVGDITGPTTFGSEDCGADGVPLGTQEAYVLARAAAVVADTRLGWVAGRCRPRPVEEAPVPSPAPQIETAPEVGHW